MTATSEPQSPPTTTPDPTGRISFGRLLAWSSSHASQAGSVIVLTYFTIYCTDTLGLAPAVVGGLLLASKLVDAVGVLFAGWLVDASPETRWGKARPYDLAIIGIWVFTAVLFSTPGGLGEVAEYAWVFVSYLLVTAVFSPLFLANQPLYLARAFANRDAYTKASSASGIVIGVISLVVGIVFPVLVGQAGKSTTAWSHMILVFAVPLALIGLIRFCTVRETHQPNPAEAQRATLRDIMTVLKSNPYLWSVSGIQFVIAVLGNFGALAYYYRYVVGNVGLLGIAGALAILILPVMLFFPRIIKRYSISAIIMVSSVLGAIGFAMYSFAGANIPLLLVAALFTAAGSTPIAFLLPVLVIDNATYNESKGNRRLESVGGGVTSFAQNLGVGVAAGIGGIVLSIAGYDGTRAVQTPSATLGIIAVNSWLPAALSIVAAVIAWRYQRFERDLPAITASVMVQRERAAKGTASGDDTGDGPTVMR
ncbi:MULTISPECIES: MFS transporter [unclassified Curtobacterium]|uniref:MFS transporter n=1 Tax=unclassified Curtobacterium TaxID=257496 RepID=UPI000F4B79EC|nr:MULTISPECIES: MFS transporter [unclassified Curtobacterium]ROP58507.1 putative glucitol transport protein GutA [Curtobacterium sp. ZW137]TCK59269.1 putative glucitol transport protein GutA [Curtobacterium sp. PhB136]